MLTGLYQYTVRGAAVTLWPQDTATDQRLAELDDYYASHPKEAADTPMTGAFAGKNLIFIMMESMDDWLVTPEYMPNLWRMEQEGLYFPNYYAPIFLAAATFNSEFTANTGLIAPEYQVRNSYYACRIRWRTCFVTRATAPGPITRPTRTFITAGRST